MNYTHDTYTFTLKQTQLSNIRQKAENKITKKSSAMREAMKKHLQMKNKRNKKE